jgi:diaminopimelate decarboxylase
VADEHTWWSRPGLEVRDGRLHVAGRDAERVAGEHGTPTYVHDLVHVRGRAEQLRDALAAAGLRGVVRLALKAQRDPGLMAFLRAEVPFVGMDVCSPGELAWAIEHGWASHEISYTGTNLSQRDLEPILASGCHLNVDLLSQLERVGRLAPGASLGIRVNPGIGATHEGGQESKYAGAKPTKFGILPERLDEAIEIARRHDLTIDTVHYHSGYLYLSDSIPVVEEAARRVSAIVRELVAAGCPIAEVNTGGGLGVPFRPGQEPLDLDAWAQALARQLGDLDVIVGTEPGEFLAKEMATLLAEVVTVEDRAGTTFVGLDVGWNASNERFVYRIPYHPILCRDAAGDPVDRVTVTGHINEGDDVFAEDHPLPAVREGDVVAFPNVGSYNHSMASLHCLRPPAGVVSFADRT